jgi:SSS family solute:Na+ symporter
MNMHWIDWAIVAAFAAMLICVAVYVNRFNRCVADFLAANRCAGRYLLTISQDAGNFGAISAISWFQVYYNAGFSATWWNMMTWPIILFLNISGWVAYRYRETRVMTLAQLFEIRYSRRFRIFCGILAWTAGVVNMGIFPAVTAQFIIYICGLPHSFTLLAIHVPTFVLIMAIELSLCLLFTFMGGLIAVMVTDFVQGVFCNIVFVVIISILLLTFDWQHIISSLKTAPADASMINPFKSTKVEGFNIGYFLVIAFTLVYGWRAWQGTQGFNAAAKSPHETKMAGIIGMWRTLIVQITLLVIPICAFTLLNHHDFSPAADSVRNVVGTIDSEQIRKQVTIPLALTKILPAGILGLFCATMFAAAVSTDNTYLHSWGSIFIQDVILPFRKTKFSAGTHMMMLRLSILLVAILVFFFSLLFRQTDYIAMYMAATGAIYLGGAGAVILGGLYWKRGSAHAAWAAMLVGMSLGGGGILVQEFWGSIVPLLKLVLPHWQFLLNNTRKLPFTGIQISFCASLSAMLCYVFVSLFDWLVLNKPSFEMDRMLHRGKWAIKGEHADNTVLPPTGWRALLPDKEFTLWDKCIHAGTTAWAVGWSLFFISILLINCVWGISDRWWAGYWHFYIRLFFVLSIICTIWLLFGGLRDVRNLFHTLRTAERNAGDDGTVAAARNTFEKVAISDGMGISSEKGAKI